jgi:purine-binding chemotaxis protein CheW
MPGAELTAMAMDPLSADQYLIFRLAGQDYGIDILRVQEIRAWERPTRLPHAPAHVQGVINLRGAVVPILDLRTRFGLTEVERDGSPVVIVITTPAPHAAVVTGVVVDAVCEVCEINSGMVQPPPQLGSGIDADLVRGLYTVNGQLLVLLDAEQLVSRVAQRPAASSERCEDPAVAGAL